MFIWFIYLFSDWYCFRFWVIVDKVFFLYSLVKKIDNNEKGKCYIGMSIVK